MWELSKRSKPKSTQIEYQEGKVKQVNGNGT